MRENIQISIPTVSKVNQLCYPSNYSITFSEAKAKVKLQIVLDHMISYIARIQDEVLKSEYFIT